MTVDLWPFDYLFDQPFAPPHSERQEPDLRPARTVEASLEFANPWHDELGKFAPKGKGVSRRQFDAAQRLAQEKARRVPQPSDDAIIDHQVDAMLAADGLQRSGGERRGNSKDRAARARALARQFGDGATCPCVQCGVMLAGDPQTALDKGIDMLTQDKIITGRDGGGYQLANLMPVCSRDNSIRGDRDVGVTAGIKPVWGDPAVNAARVVTANQDEIQARYEARSATIRGKRAAVVDGDALRVGDVAADRDLQMAEAGLIDSPVVERSGDRFDGDGVVVWPGVWVPFGVDGFGGVDQGAIPPEAVTGDDRADRDVLDVHADHGSQFGNPWHDEEGKFAPKGMGSTAPAAPDAPSGTPAEPAAPAGGKSVKDRVKAAFDAKSVPAPLGAEEAGRALEEFDSWAGEMGPDFMQSDNAQIMRQAFADIQGGSKGMIARGPNGVTGAVSYDFIPADVTGGEPMYIINSLGSTGITPGVGSQLTSMIMRSASINKAGVTLTVASNDSAPQFWTSIGFKGVKPGDQAEMSAADVARWVEDVKK